MALANPRCEAIAQSADCGLALEAREARSEHELCSRYELWRMWAQREEGGHAELLEERVALRVSSAHQHDHLVIQLERARLELDAAGTCMPFCQYMLQGEESGELTYLCRTRNQNLDWLFRIYTVAVEGRGTNRCGRCDPLRQSLCCHYGGL